MHPPVQARIPIPTLAGRVERGALHSSVSFPYSQRIQPPPSDGSRAEGRGQRGPCGAGARRLSPLDPQSVSDRRKEGLQRVWAACREGRPPVRTAAALLCVHTIGAVGGSSLSISRTGFHSGSWNIPSRWQPRGRLSRSRTSRRRMSRSRRSRDGLRTMGAR
jgi:hypothetical protein